MQHGTSRQVLRGRSLAPIAIGFFLASALQTAQGQLTVDDFPSLKTQDFSYVSQERVDGYTDEALQTSVEPFQIFDNLYYVGIEWVGSYLLVTSDGLILIDSLHEPYVETSAENIRKLGFDPADVRYVVGTHGHFDHVGGHAYYQETFGSRVGMAAGDWKRAQTDAHREFWGMDMADVDMVIQDGDTLELGEQTMTFYITPGHTEGVLSMEFTVRDGADSHRAVIYGGSNSLLPDYWRYQTVLGNLRRFKLLAAQSPSFTVRIPTHPNQRFIERRDRLQTRGAGDPHPFVDDPSVFFEALEQSERNAERGILALP